MGVAGLDVNIMVVTELFTRNANVHFSPSLGNISNSIIDCFYFQWSRRVPRCIATPM